jgi:hypothetical protein
VADDVRGSAVAAAANNYERSHHRNNNNNNNNNNSVHVGGENRNKSIYLCSRRTD